MENKSVLTVEWIDCDDIRPYVRNSRRNDPTVAEVAKSIEQFGWQQPIVVDQNNIIVAGHSRWRAAKQLKQLKVPVIRFKGTSEQAHYYRILDNRSQENSDWDMDLLRGELIDLDRQYPTGFTDQEIDKILGASESQNKLAEKTVFEIVVTCENETQQQELYDYVSKELKRECRVLSI